MLKKKKKGKIVKIGCCPVREGIETVEEALVRSVNSVFIFD